MEIISFGFLLGALFVAVYALDRFNTPQSNRASTTAGRYYSAALAYALIAVSFYYFFAQYPHLLALLNLGNGAEHLEALDEEDVSPVLVAMLLSVLLGKIPVLAQLDAKLRVFLQSLAEIPLEALRLGRRIQRARFNPNTEVRRAVFTELNARGFDAEDIRFEPAAGAQARWCRLTALMLGLRHWESQRGFIGFVHERQDEIKTLRERYEQLGEVAKNCFSLSQQAQAMTHDSTLNDAALKLRNTFLSQTDALSNDLSALIAQGVLRCQLTHGTRCQAVKRMGFEPPDDERVSGISINHFLTLLAILVPMLLVNFILFRRAGGGPDMAVALAVQIGTTYMLAVYCAVAPKRWTLLKAPVSGHRPVAAYFVSGFMAVAAAIPIQLLFKALALSKSEDGLLLILSMVWERFTTQGYPWLVMAFVTAFVTAFLCDNRPSKRFGPRTLRAIEAIAQSVATALAALLVLWWLGVDPGTEPRRWIRILTVSALIGMLLGALVPAWYRDALGRSRGHNAPNPRDEEKRTPTPGVSPIQPEPHT